MSFAQKVIATSSDRFVFIRAQTLTGDSCYFVMSCNNQNTAQLQQQKNHEQVDLTRYGKVVASGYSTTPTAYEIARFYVQYNYDLRLLLDS